MPQASQHTAYHSFYANTAYALQDTFVGRKQELAALDQWLASENTPLVALIAPDGAGKSALTWHWQNLLKKNEAIEGVFWWDTYQLEGGILEFLHASLQFIGDDPHIYSDGRHQLERLLDQLRYRPILFVIDGVERWLHIGEGLDCIYLDEEKLDTRGHALDCVHTLTAELLHGLATLNGETKTAVTSQFLPRELKSESGEALPTVRHHPLNEMPPDDIAALFKRKETPLAPAALETICAPIDYHPLTANLLAGSGVREIVYPPDSSLAERQQAAFGVVYKKLPPSARQFLSELAAFPRPVDQQIITALFNGRIQPHLPAAPKKKQTWSRFFRKGQDKNTPADNPLSKTLRLLKQRSLLHRVNQRDADGNAVVVYTTHNLVRRYAYRQLKDPVDIHRWAADYYQKHGSPDSERNLINRYYHLVRSNQFDEAFIVYRQDVLPILLPQISAYRQTMIEMLQMLFPDGEFSAPRLSGLQAKVSALHELGELYDHAGRPTRAMPLYKQSVMILKNHADKGLMAESLNKLVATQLRVGGLKVADRNGKRSLDLHEEIALRYKRIPGHWNYGRLLSYRGEAAKAKIEFGAAMGLAKAENAIHAQCVTWAYWAQLALTQGDAKDGYAAAKKSRQLAARRAENRDIILADWVMGWACLQQKKWQEAERYLDEALRLCRADDLVEFEPAILLAQAKLARSAAKDMKSAQQLAETAVRLAERADYKLDLAEIYNFLTRLALDEGNYEEAHRLAKKTQRYARCDGDGYAYKAALDNVNRLLKMMSYTL